ncbi:MAG: hypothetical protein Q6373_021235 [Candidatus Sigynarchaeota archaeon]
MQVARNKGNSDAALACIPRGEYEVDFVSDHHALVLENTVLESSKEQAMNPAIGSVLFLESRKQPMKNLRERIMEKKCEWFALRSDVLKWAVT